MIVTKGEIRLGDQEHTYTSRHNFRFSQIHFLCHTPLELDQNHGKSQETCEVKWSTHKRCGALVFTLPLSWSPGFWEGGRDCVTALPASHPIAILQSWRQDSVTPCVSFGFHFAPSLHHGHAPIMNMIICKALHGLDNRSRIRLRTTSKPGQPPYYFTPRF